MQSLSFKSFLICEASGYFGLKISSVLESLQELSEDVPNIGTRIISRRITTIVNQIRQILRDRWSDREVPHLKSLQKIGVALMQAVDEKGDVPSTINASIAELQKVIGKTKMPANDLGSEIVGED